MSTRSEIGDMSDLRGRSLIAGILLFIFGCCCTPCAATAGEFDEYGFFNVTADESPPEAGRHPDVMLEFTINHRIDGEGLPVLSARTEDLSVELPAGLVGDPTNVGLCKGGEFEGGTCPVDSQVGVVSVLLEGHTKAITEPLYNLEPAHPDSAVARFGFVAVFYPAFVDVHVRTGSDYGVTATLNDASGQAPVLAATTHLWAVPAATIHDAQRLTPLEALLCESGTACLAPEGKRSVDLPELPFLTNPSACQSMQAAFAATSYQLPGRVFEAVAPMASITGCEQVPFQGTLSTEPSSHVAGAPTGLKTVLRIPQNEDPRGIASSTMREAEVDLPAGMTINAAAAQGLEACSSDQVHLGSAELDAECPDGSKLGSVAVVSPALPLPLHGSLYQRTPEKGHQFRLWLTAAGYGLHLKLPGEVRGDARTGNLTVSFPDLPQLPVEEITLDVFGGDRAPLKNPDSCGTYATTYKLAPWSGNSPATGQSYMDIDEGCGLGFSPRLQAGTLVPRAKSFSPLVFSLSRRDGEENLRGIEVVLPDGLLAEIKGVPLCGESEAASGSCPAASKIGSVNVAAGAGPTPLWIPQSGADPSPVYLSGPYAGAPYSIVAAVPAKAGPFDFGSVALRSTLELDPASGQAVIKTDPLPQVLEGATISYRTIHVLIDRPHFVLNPTDCSEMAIKAAVSGADSTISHPASRFQIEGCQHLKFHPRLSLRLRGGSNRGEYPALTAVLRTRRADANLRSVSVALPHSEFLAQEHIGTICTRTQFAINKCPRGSVYGYAKAWTPLLSKPLTGPVYLRSSDHPLPDLVVSLRGQVEIDLAGRISSRAGGIQTTFNSVPDAPVTKFVLRMRGGSKGLLVNSTDLCRSSRRAQVSMGAQNGRIRDFRPHLHLKAVSHGTGITCQR
jgi:hypothetical protein